MHYIALMRKEPDSDFSVDFPDLPGCITAGLTLDEAMRNAQEAAELYLEVLAEKGERLPAPSDLEAILADPHNHDATAFIVRPAFEKGRAVRVGITIDEHLLARLDDAAKAAGTSRSGFLAEAARKQLSG